MVFVVFACRTFMKPALQATLRVFGLCGSCVVLVWSALWFLVMCGFWLWSCPRCRCSRLRVHLPAGLCGSVVLRVHLPAWLARPIARPLALCGSVVLPSMPKPMIARPFALCGSVVLPSMPMLASGLARPLARRDCASSGFPYCQKGALELQALTR